MGETKKRLFLKIDSNTVEFNQGRIRTMLINLKKLGLMNAKAHYLCII